MPDEAKKPKRDSAGLWLPGTGSPNPGGVSKEKRAFLERLRSEDAEEIYAAFMDGVRAREWTVVLRAVEYIAGKPAAAKEDHEAMRAGIDARLPLTREEMLRALGVSTDS